MKIIQLIKASVFLVLIVVNSSCRWDQLGPEFECSKTPIEIELSEQNDTECGASTGGFVAIASGGVAPYEYRIGGETSADGVFANLEAGTYAVLATDINGCSNELSVVIKNLSGVNFTDLSSSQAGCGTSSGMIEATAVGGVPPYTFSLNGGVGQESSSFAGLDPGSYLISVADQSGCETIETVEILSGISYDQNIKEIIKNNCTRCHANFVEYSNVKSKASQIRSRTQSGNMPKDATLPQAQIDAIACWVDDGALQN